ncbi:cadherin-like domain-containing protein, partial [Vibrio sp. D449a]
DDVVLGRYTFTLLEALDHEDGLDNNTLSFDLPVYAVDSDGDDSLMSPLTVTIEDDVQGMSNGILNIEEPTVADLAAGVVTTTTIDVMPEQSADGATITEFTYDGSTPLTLDQTDTGEQEFIFTEGSLFITLEGDVRFEPNRNLDHEDGPIVKSIVVTSSDGDVDVETATVTLTITDGDIPTIETVPSVSLSETQLADGSTPSGSAVSQTETISFTNQSDDVEKFRIEPTEFNVGGALTSNNIAVEIKEDPADSGIYVGFIDDGGTEVPIFTLSFSTTTLGEYTFTLLEALDHADGLDNNELTFDLPVYAVDSDGNDSLMSPLSVTIGDDVQVMATGTLDITEPTVADLAAGIVTTNTIDVMPKQSADGAVITQFTYDGGTAQTLDPTITGEQKFTFTEGDLYVTIEGNVRFEPNRDLDHKGGDIVKSLVFTSSDGDVDVETATVTLTITDGDIPTIESVPSVTLAEAGLADGSSPIMGAVSQTETISFTNQSDNVEKFRLEPTEFNTDNSLKSDGLIIELREEPTGSGNYIGFTTDISNVETTVFTLDFSSTTLGEYTFSLLEAIDHAPIQGNNDLTFSLPVYAVDSDGDDSLMSPLSVTITDDVQVMAGVTISIEEPTVADLAAGTPTTSVYDVLTSASADGANVTQFTYDGAVYALDQTDSSEQEFTFTEGSLFITIQGEVRFEPNRDLDHSGGDIVKNIVVTSSDGDSDVLTSTVTLTITDGDVPTIDVIPPISLSESNLTGGSDPTVAAVSDTKVIQFTNQSDDVVSFRIEPTLFNTLGALTSNNLAVQIKEDPNNPGDYIGFVKDTSNVETNVFTISFSDSNLGQYTFTLLEALDHADGLDKNTVIFDVPVLAVDSDGDDSLMSPLTVTIEDDVQGMSNGILNIEEPTVADLAAGVVTTTTIDVMPEQSADGATITEFTYDGGTPLMLDQTDTGEQEFIFTEGSLFITLEGDVRFEPNRNLDHEDGPIVKSIVVTSSDGDVDVETATVTLTITDGDIPTIETVPSVSLSETQLADGSTPNGSAVSQTETISFTNQSDDVEKFRLEPTQFNTGGTLTSNNIAAELKEDPVDSGNYVGFINDGGTEVPVFTLSFSGTTLGEYTFTLLEALDHADGLDNNELTFDLPVYAVDSDGNDSLMSPLLVTIGDDVQIMANGTLDITEPTVADLAAGMVTTNTIDVMPKQSADGAVITQFTYDGGTAQTLDTAIIGEQEFIFTEGSVFVTIEGNVRFEPNRNLDHEDGDIIKSLVFTSSDGDVDVETATVTLTITDGDIPTIESVPSIALAEADLDDGSSPIVGAVSQTETISFTNQSDNVEKFRLEPNEFNTDDSLKSNGLAIDLKEDPAGSGNYIGFTNSATNVETQIFTLNFSAAPLGQYTFTLLESIDHEDGRGNNDLTFELPVYAVDTDGDDSLMSPLSVTITDDIQVMASGSLSIEEPTVADLAASTPTTLIFDVLTSPSADGASVTQFTYDGTAYTLDQSIATEQEFTFTEGSLFITTQGDVRFESNRDLDHSGGDIVKSIVVTSSDGDEDVLTSTVKLTITDGDVPTIDVIPPISLSESNLTDGSDPTVAAVSDTKVIQFTDQSDDVVSFRIEPTLFNPLGALTSNNLAVQIKEDPNSAGDYIGFIKDASDVETNVFTISFSDSNLGQYTFTLLEALDHEDGLDKNMVTFDVPVLAVDSDGNDSAMSQLKVTIEDDEQEMSNGILTIEEPTVAELAAGVVTTTTIDVMPKQSADGATITEFTYDGGTPLMLDQTDTGEQEFIFTEGSLFITLEGDVRFEPNRNLDHEDGPIVKSIVVTSSDGDVDVETATVTLTITDGDIPTIETVPSVSLSETQLADGSSPSGSAVSQTETISFTNQSDDVEKFRLEPTEFNVGGALTSNNIAVELKEDPADSGIYVGFIDDGGTEVPVFTLSFSTTTLGEYTFALLEALDHADGLDNNELTFDLPVYAVDSDGNDSLMSPLSVTIGDDVQVMATGTLDITEPTVADLAAGTVTTNTIDVMPKQSADGAVITQFTYDGGAAQTLDPTITGEQEFTFTEGSVFVSIEGNVRFEPNRNLDHEDGDIIKSLVFTSSDGDVDVKTATVTLTITDGDIPTIESVPSITLAEAELDDGSSPIVGAVSQTETISFTNQSDNVEKFRLEPNEFNTDNSLKSDGLIIEIREEPVGSGSYIGFTTSILNVETTVFTVDFSSTTLGEYTFTLLEAIDHRPIQGNNDLTFNLPVYAVDTDGDDSLMSPLAVTVTDDIQSLVAGSMTAKEPSTGVETSNTINLMPDSSADGGTLTSFSYDGEPLQTLNQNVAGEQSFTYDEGTLFVSIDGSMRFEPVSDLDHSSGNITKTIFVNSVDGDGDIVSTSVSLAIIDGDAPVIDTVPDIALNEANLDDGSSSTGTAVSDTKVITFTEGSDDVTHFRVDTTNFNTMGTLKSNGLAVEIKEQPTDSGNYVGFVTDASNVETNVFTLEFSDSNLGQYTLTLLEALDHADASFANTLDFDIPVIAVDADNTDSASSSLNVTITDDLQQTQNQTLSIVEPVTTSGAGGPPSTGIVDVMPKDSADGATVTQFMYGTDGPFVLDQTNFTEQEFAVADGKLFVKLDGSVRFEPGRNLDHSGGDIVRTITVTTSDFDKDVETATVTLTITDGVDPVINIVPDVYLSEVNLTDGSMPSSGPVSSTHTITYTEGSDNFSHFRIDTNEFNFGGLLKSNGLVVSLKEEPADSGTYIGFTSDGPNNETDIFTISFDSVNKGQFTITLLEAVDHLNGLNYNDLNFRLPIYAVDTDDSESARRDIVVTIEDDIQQMQDGILAITEPTSGTPTTATVDVMPLPSADGATITEFTYDGGLAISLNQNIVGEQEFTFTEGSLFVTLDGDVRFEPNRNLDHSGGNIVKNVVFTSSDFDNDVFMSSVRLTIIDGEDPELNVVPGVNLSESNLSDGSAPDSNLISETNTITTIASSDDIAKIIVNTSLFNVGGTIKSNGLVVDLREDPVNSGDYLAFTTVSPGVEVPIFTLTFDNLIPTKYTFTLLEHLDHPDGDGNNEISFDLSVRAQDTDGDLSDPKPLEVIISDDVQVMQSGDLLVEEPTSGTVTSNVFETITGPSADGSTVTGFTYDGGSEELLDQNDTNEQVFVYPEGTLYIKLNGDIRFEPNRNLDHEDGDIIKNIVVNSLDRDLDPEDATVRLIISDGAPPTIDIIPPVGLSEVNLADGSSPSLPVSQTEQMTFTAGSDDVSYFRIETTEFNDNGALKSNGLSIQLKEDPSVSGGYIGFTTEDPVNGPEVEIFKISFSSSVLGQYTFTLLQEIDHADVQGNNDQVFTLPVYAVDTDETDSAMKPLSVTITDDVPEITDTGVGSTFIVDEEDIGNPTQATGSFVTTEGADQVDAYELRNITTLEAMLSSGNEGIEITEVTGAANTTTYQGATETSGVPIFTLALTNDGDYTFTLLGPLNHATTPTNLDTLTIPFDVVAVDGDGDDSNQYRLPIEVLDDGPTMTDPTGETIVDEDDLAGIGSDQTEDTIINGLFTIDEGADGVVLYELVNPDAVLTGLTSEGENLEWLPVVESGTTFTYTAQTETSNEAVFEIVFDTSDNSYQFELFKPLAHPNPDLIAQNSIPLNFSVVAEDFDGDQSNAIALNLSVTDDVPLVTTQSITRLEGQGYNGSKVNMFATATDTGADGAVLSRIEGISDNGSNIVFQRGNNTDFSDALNIVSGRRTIRVYEQTEDGMGGTEERQLGTLRINSNGEVEFRANSYLEHDGDEINFSINVIATDGDLDTSETPLDITIVDRDSTAISLKVTTTEDIGRDPSIVYATGSEPTGGVENTFDNQDGLPDTPAKVELQVNFYDRDNNEDIGQLKIFDNTNHRGTFYYYDGAEYVKLAEDVDGNFILDGADITRTLVPAVYDPDNPSDTIATIENLYFVPDRNFSTGENGVRINYELEIDNNGVPDHTVSSNFRIEIEAVADEAIWDDVNSTFTYLPDTDNMNQDIPVTEDGNTITLNLEADTQDTSRSETITYQLTVIEGAGNFTLLDSSGNPIGPVGGPYIIDEADINSTVVDPIDNFSGTIRFEAVALTEETRNPFTDSDNAGANDKTTASSEVRILTIDVLPDADLGTLSVNRKTINEDNILDPDIVGDPNNTIAFTLDEVITMTPSEDMDASETLYVRINNITEGAELYELDTDNVIPSVTIEGVEYREILYSQLDQVEVRPKEHSNEDFSFDVLGVVKDEADLSTGTVVDEVTFGPKTVNVEVIGVADVPFGGTNGTDWEEFTDGGVSGVQTTIQESQNGDSFAVLDFTVLSGERRPDDPTDAPLAGDGSESITVILSGIPDGVVIEDGDGTVIDLNFVGYEDDINGNPDLDKPIYEANITEAGVTSGIRIRPVDSSTENIHIQGRIVVTENDGHTLTFDQEVRVLVEPRIDTSATYSNTTTGNEDTAINIDWHPQGADYIDDDEHFTSITINGIPTGVVAVVNGDVAVDSSTPGTLIITPKDASQTPEQFTQIALANDFIQMTPPQNSSVDFTLTTVVEMEERDFEYTDDAIVGEGGRVVANPAITGTITVQVVPVVEPEDPDGDNVDENYIVFSNENGTGELTSITSDNAGVIKFTTNSDNQAVDGGGVEILDGEYVIRYKEDDVSPVFPINEVVNEVVIQLTTTTNGILPEEVLSQLLVTGAVYEGDGRWVVTDEDAFTISAPEGLDLTAPYTDGDENNTSSIKMTVFTQVEDLGDETDDQNSAIVQRQGDVTLTFPEDITGGGEIAADIVVTPDQTIAAQEDTQVMLGDELENIISFINGDTFDDEITIIFDDTVTISDPNLNPDPNPEVFPISIEGSGEIDFVNGKYVYQTTLVDGTAPDFSDLLLNLPADYSGDFELPFTVITKDLISGDEKVLNTSAIIKVSAVTDVAPSISVNITGSLDDSLNPVDIDGQPGAEAVGYEDTYIVLDFSGSVADQVNGVEGGDERFTDITLTLTDTTNGEFYSDTGTPLGTSISFTESEIENGALSGVLFRPKENFPTYDDANDLDISTVSVTVSGNILDTATFNEDGSSTTEDATSEFFSTPVSFEVVPVVDGIQITGPGTNPNIIEIQGQEDQEISLSGMSDPVSIALTDLDGSEEFVSIKFTDVPDGFQFRVDDSSDFTVKNNGGGVWSVQLPSDASTSFNLDDISVLPPKDFSGTFEFGVEVFTQESLLGVPTNAGTLPKFQVHVLPVGDDIDTDPTDSVSGNEGENIDIAINASILDKEDSAPALTTENDPETIRVVVSNVPSDASILYPDGTTLGTYDAVSDTWTLDVDAITLDKIVFNSGEHNSDTGNALGIDAPLSISIRAVDTDADNTEYLGPETTFNVDLVIDPINDQPTFVNIENLETPEDTSIALSDVSGFKIEDPDAVYDDPNAIYILDLEVDKGTLSYTASTGVTVDPVSGTGTELTLTGTLADINNALDNGSVRFELGADQNYLTDGVATVTATVDDGGNNGSPGPLTNVSTFEIKVTEVNDDPVARDVDLGSISEEGQVTIIEADLLAASSDLENHNLQITDLVITQGSGTLQRFENVAGADDAMITGPYWIFTGADDFNGDVKFDYTVEDDGTTNGVADPKTDTAELSLVVTSVNDMPVAPDINLGTIAEDDQIVIKAEDLIAASTDPEGDNLTVTDVSLTSGQGQLQYFENSGGADDPSITGPYWVFDANDEYDAASGNISFTYTIQDDGQTNGVDDFLTDTGDLSLTVTGVNDSPVINSDNVTSTIDEDVDQLISGITVADPDYVGLHAGDFMTVTLSVDFGTLSATLPGSTTITVSGQGTSSIMLEGTPADINGILNTPTNPVGVFVNTQYIPSNSIKLQVVAEDSGNPSGIIIETPPEEFTIQVTPVANAPSLSIDPAMNYVRNITASQTASMNGIPLVGIVAALADVNEILTLNIKDVPAGASVISSAGTVALNGGVWVASADAIDSLKIVDLPEDATPHTIKLEAVSSELDDMNMVISPGATSSEIDLNLTIVADATDIDLSTTSDDVQLMGDGGNAVLEAGSGDDLIEGGSGNDELIGGDGNDTLIGGDGFDILTGGDGMDAFVWLNIQDGVEDTITDFDLSEGDSIDLREVLPELQNTTLDMAVLLQHIDAKVVDVNNIELTINPDGMGTTQQVIVVEDLAPQLTLASTTPVDILDALVQQNVITHG